MFTGEPKLSKKWEKLNNKAMARKLSSGDCVDLSKCEKKEDSTYIVLNFIEGVDYCDAEKEIWIWSIGQDKKTGEILASHDTRFYQNQDYKCLWLR